MRSAWTRRGPGATMGRSISYGRRTAARTPISTRQIRRKTRSRVPIRNPGVNQSIGVSRLSFPFSPPFPHSSTYAQHEAVTDDTKMAGKTTNTFTFDAGSRTATLKGSVDYCRGVKVSDSQDMSASTNFYRCVSHGSDYIIPTGWVANVGG
jgi:hypothetical protein